MPHLKELHRRYADQGLVLIGVHTTNGSEKMAAYAEAEEIPFPICNDVGGKTVEGFAVDSYPDYYVIDRAGKLRVADLANAELDRAIEVLLAEPAPVADPRGRKLVEPTEPGLEVLVVDAGGRPVPDAEISVVRRKSVEQRKRPPHERFTWFDWFELHDDPFQTGKTDSRGRFVTSLRGDLSVVARLGDGFAWDSVDGQPEGDELRLQLEPDTTLAVQAVDAAGKPCAGVDVLLYRFSKGSRSFGIYSPVAVAWSGRTAGEDGIARLEHAQLLFSREAKARYEYELALGIPVRALDRLAIDPWNLPAQPVRLRMPETGSVVIEMADAPKSWARVRSMPDNDGSRANRGAESFWSRSQPVRALFDDGRVRFRYVGVGTQLQMQAHWEGMISPASLIGPGPKEAGEEVVYRVEGRQAAGELTLDPARVTFLEGTDDVEIGEAYLSQLSPDGNRFQLCLVPRDPKGARDRDIAFHVDGKKHSINGWHGGMEGGEGHLFCYLYDPRVIEMVSRALEIPVTRRKERPYRLETSFSPDADSYPPRSAIRVGFEVWNVGETTLDYRVANIRRGDDRHELFDFRITRDGEEIETLPVEPKDGSYGIHTHRFLPGESFEDEAWLSRWAKFDVPGVYEVEASYTLEIATPLDFDGPACPGAVSGYVDVLRGSFEVRIE